MSLPRIAFISTGGTIGGVTPDPLNILDYGVDGSVLDGSGIVQRIAEAKAVADIDVYDAGRLISTAIGFPVVRQLAALCDRICREKPDITGIVIGHGTSTLEETAYLLHLCLKVSVPVVIVGSQRPLSALSSDAGMNFIGALRVAASPEARGKGVLVVLNDEIHSARDVTKTSTVRLHAFRSPEFGPLGCVDGPHVLFYRDIVRRAYPRTEFDVSRMESLPRVDIAYSHMEADGVAVRAFVDAGAQGIVIAGFGPGAPADSEHPAYRYAAERGVVLLQASRCGTGRAYVPSFDYGGYSCITADNLSPHKARILLSLGLAFTSDKARLQEMFDIY
ncbi:MAG: asparaginase [Sphingobium sp.]